MFVGDPAYDDVDRLDAIGLLDSVIVGQRPYSRREFARVARIARRRFELLGEPTQPSQGSEVSARMALGVLGRLEARFGPDDVVSGIEANRVSLVDGLGIEILSTDASRRGFPPPHTKPVETTIDPLVPRRLGQPVAPGQMLSFEISQRIEPFSWLAFQARERAEHLWPSDTSLGHERAELLLAMARARFRNVALSVGREQFAWAQGDGDGLFLASDAPALDQISIASDAPFVLPNVLRQLGPTRATLILADLGPSVVRPHSKLLAYKLSAQPRPWLELGGTFMNHFGGEGGVASARWNQLIDFLPFIDIFRSHNYTDSTRTVDVDSDKLLGLDGRVRIQRLAGMTIAGELLIDDFDVHALPRLLTGYGSSTVRVLFPTVLRPDVAVRIGAKHLGTITYTHPRLSNGITTRGRLLGDELGPDAKEFSAEIRWFPRWADALTLEGREQIYSNATYAGGYTDSAHVQTNYFKVSHTDDERRHIVSVGVRTRQDARVSVIVRGGLQIVENSNFTGQRRADYLVDVAFRLNR